MKTRTTTAWTIAIAMGLAGQASAIHFFDGSPGGAGTDWHTLSNWGTDDDPLTDNDPAALPTLFDDVEIPKNGGFAVNIAAGNTGEALSLLKERDNTLSVDGILNVDGIANLRGETVAVNSGADVNIAGDLEFRNGVVVQVTGGTMTANALSVWAGKGGLEISGDGSFEVENAGSFRIVQMTGSNAVFTQGTGATVDNASLGSGNQTGEFTFIADAGGISTMQVENVVRESNNNGFANMAWTLDLTAQDGLTDGQTYTLLQATSGMADFAANLPPEGNPDVLSVIFGPNDDAAGLTADLIYDTTNERVQVSIVPEPTSLALIGLGGLLMSRRHRH